MSAQNGISITHDSYIILLSVSFPPPPSQEFTLKRLFRRSHNRNVQAWKAQVKIACIVIYYILLGVMGLVIYTYTEANNTYQESITKFILCKSTGQSDCTLDFSIDDDVLAGMVTTIYLMIALIPVVAILFSCNPQKCKKALSPSTP